MFIAAGHKGDEDQFLLGEPAERLLAQVAEIVAVDIFEPGLVGGLVIGNAHGIRVPAAHVVLYKIDCGSVFAADHVGLFHRLAVNIVKHIDFRSAPAAKNQLKQDFLTFGNDDTGAVRYDRIQHRWERKFF